MILPIWYIYIYKKHNLSNPHKVRFTTYSSTVSHFHSKQNVIAWMFRIIHFKIQIRNKLRKSGWQRFICVFFSKRLKVFPLKMMLCKMKKRWNFNMLWIHMYNPMWKLFAKVEHISVVRDFLPWEGGMGMRNSKSFIYSLYREYILINMLTGAEHSKFNSFIASFFWI